MKTCFLLVLAFFIAAPDVYAAPTSGIEGLPGLSAWYQADKAKVINGRLTDLLDVSGKGHHITAGAKPPLVAENVLHGHPVLRFTGGESPLVDEHLDWSASGFTVFVVAAYDNIPAQPAIRDNPSYIIDTPAQALVSDGGSNGLAMGLNWNGRPGAAAGISQADSNIAFDPPYPNEQASDLVITARKFYAFTYASSAGKNNKTANAWDCRVSLTTAANNTTASLPQSPFFSTQAMNGGHKLQIAAADARDGFKGDIAEIVVFNRELSAAERETVQLYLRGKYGLEDIVKRLPPEPVVISPTLTGGNFWFQRSVAVHLTTATVGAEIRYTLDGSEPAAASPLFKAPLTISASRTIKARAFAPGRDPGVVSSAAFIKIAPVAASARKLPGGWKNSWADEFDGPQVNEAIWGYELGYVRNSEAQFYSDRTENSRIDHGNLLIEGRHDNWNGHEWTSAARSTENKVKLTYGRYEVRAKIDTRSGCWPAWWLWSRPDAAGWPKEGEIDMMEYYTGKTLFNIVDGNGNFDSKRKKINALGGERWGQNYHVWTMDWDANKIDLSLDGVLMSHYPLSKADGTGVNGANPYRTPGTKKMVLNLALGGSMGGNLKAADAPFEMRVDWVRVHTWSNEPAYTVTVHGGTGSGAYVPGTRASLTASMPPAGYTFDRWILAGKASLSDPRAASATMTMPASDATVFATYLPVP